MRCYLLRCFITFQKMFLLHKSAPSMVKKMLLSPSKYQVTFHLMRYSWSVLRFKKVKVCNPLFSASGAAFKLTYYHTWTSQKIGGGGFYKIILIFSKISARQIGQFVIDACAEHVSHVAQWEHGLNNIVISLSLQILQTFASSSSLILLLDSLIFNAFASFMCVSVVTSSLSESISVSFSFKSECSFFSLFIWSFKLFTTTSCNSSLWSCCLTNSSQCTNLKCISYVMSVENCSLQWVQGNIILS